jgi:hypothetical protein
MKRRMGFPDMRLGKTSGPPVETSTKDEELDRFVERVVARLERRD